MIPSEKIKLIKEISVNLSTEEWSLIDLTLKQFDFPTTEEFSGNKFDYVLKHIENGDEDSLVNLGSHLDVKVDSAESELNPTFWKDGYFKLFISHLASDKINAQKLKDKLEKYGISGFVAHSDIEPTRVWQDEIEMALRTGESLVALMIPGFHESKWTDQEIGLALGRDLLIIPVRMGQDPYGFIGKFQAITFTDFNALAEDIFDSLLKNKKTSKKIAYAVMYKFENSDSFDEAKSNIKLVARIEFWDKKLIRRLKSAGENKFQISHSFGVPEKIESIISNVKKKYGT
jgi:hypothetical protein